VIQPETGADITLEAGAVDSAPQIGVVIPAWNAIEYTLACLDSLARLRYPRFSVVVVDNGSQDGTREQVQASHPAVTVVRNERNMGFAYACNQGMDAVFGDGADYAFLLNNDTLVAPDLLSQLVAIAETLPCAGILGPKICYASQPETPWFTGMRFRLPVYIVRTQPRHQVQSDVPVPVDFVSGCGMLISRQLFRKIGGLNQDYFMYYEDLDYCLSAKKAGFEVFYVPQARMWHVLSVSSGGKDSPLKQYFQVKSAILFTRRHTRGLWRWLNLGIRFAHAGWTALKQLLRGELRWKAIRAYGRGVHESVRARKIGPDEC
jgi:GT2 family glycosyltransferase